MLTNVYKSPLNVHRVDEYVSLLEKFKGKLIIDRRVGLTVGNVRPDKKRVLVNFNSEADSRRMPIDKGRSIIDTLTKTFRDNTFSFIGSPKEAAFVDQVIAGLENKDRIENLAGKTDLVGLCSLMAASAVIVTTDSGPAHLANSVGTPTIVLFGAGNERNTAPYNKQKLTVLRYGKLECEPCVKNTCKLYGIPKCMQMIDELQIVDMLSPYVV